MLFSAFSANRSRATQGVHALNQRVETGLIVMLSGFVRSVLTQHRIIRIGDCGAVGFWLFQGYRCATGQHPLQR